MVQCIGGGISQEDISGQEAPFNTFARECYEEIGIKVEGKSVIEPYKYIYIRNHMTTFGLCYVVHLDLYKEEVMNIFKDFQGKDDEIRELVFVKKDIHDVNEFIVRTVKTYGNEHLFANHITDPVPFFVQIRLIMQTFMYQRCLSKIGILFLSQRKGQSAGQQ